MCEQVTDAVTSVVSHWCRLREIDNSNKDLIIDSTNSPGGIRFYFDDTNTGDVIDLGGNGTIQHVRCTAPLADNGGACGTNATLANFDKLLLFATGNKTVNIKGTGGLSMGILAPAGTVEILGNSTFLGVTQSNNFRANGNVTIRVPNSSSNAIGNGFGSFPVEAYDWVARGIRYSSNY
ncbi:hypothetical protein [Synechococcus sp. CBW1006]|uniref:hypothetical protein n=1 Tax=Synechococcus sp. CBW1006 TaxID=1353138 RepID=UPI0018CD5503|nr:hypothetical protein [Synechococcus sp. CBW1006]QPN65680.1 hypothetical protein H8F26_12255 [Synechococcus sp. CBW1006]